MKDDDLDLELDDEPVRPQRRPAPGAAPKAAAPRPAGSTAGSASPQSAPAQPVRERQGWLQGLSDSVAGVRGFHWNVRTFLVLLAVLVAIVVVVENWIPVRFYFFGVAFEMPRALSFLLDVALGALLMWLWLRRSARRVEAGP